MTKLWLTYAWKDNESEDVDHIVAELRKKGLDVRFDRVQLLAGHRLWEQIAAGINDPTVDGWAIYVTEHSLKSEPCQEELAYALDRTLRTRGTKFPLIGLFAGEFDAMLIPAALATRLCINLQSNDWDQQVVDGIVGMRMANQPEPMPFGYQLHERENGFFLEVWPRTGTWTPVVAAVSEDERDCLTSLVPGPRGVVGGMAMVMGGEGVEKGSFVRIMNNPVNSTTTAQISLSKLPSKITFGPQFGNTFTMTFNTTPKMPSTLNFSSTSSLKGDLSKPN